MLYSALLWHQWKRVARRLRGPQQWIKLVILTLVGGNLVFVLVTLGHLSGDLIRYTMPGQEPRSFVNQHLLAAFVGLFSLRFFLQRSPEIGIQSYLHLPIQRQRLSHFYQFFSLLSVHNVLPLLAIVPFWLRYMLGGGVGVRAASVWMAGVVLLLLTSHYALLALRATMSRSFRTFLYLVAVPVSLLVIDYLVAGGLVAWVSYHLFAELARGNALVLLGLGLMLLGTYQIAAALLQQRLYDIVSSEERRPLMPALAFVPALGDLPNLIVLELKMMWRNKRPRQFVVVSFAFSVGYLGLLLTDDLAGAPLMAAIAGLFASGFFALNYGQLMFGWESRQFDGHLARVMAPRRYVLAKLLMLQGSCIVLYLVTLPLFVWLAPHLLLLHGALLAYNIGVTCVLMLALAMRNRSRINVSNSSFLNYEGFSILHWLWFIPTLLPPALVLLALGEQQPLALFLIGGAGLLGALLTPAWVALFTRQFLRYRYAMASGFRRTAY